MCAVVKTLIRTMVILGLVIFSFAEVIAEVMTAHTVRCLLWYNYDYREKKMVKDLSTKLMQNGRNQYDASSRK